jgi:hypothetical protein
VDVIPLPREPTEQQRKKDIRYIKHLIKVAKSPPVYSVLYNGKEYVARYEAQEEKEEEKPQPKVFKLKPKVGQ